MGHPCIIRGIPICLGRQHCTNGKRSIIMFMLTNFQQDGRALMPTLHRTRRYFKIMTIKLRSNSFPFFVGSNASLDFKSLLLCCA